MFRDGIHIPAKLAEQAGKTEFVRDWRQFELTLAYAQLFADQDGSEAMDHLKNNHMASVQDLAVTILDLDMYDDEEYSYADVVDTAEELSLWQANSFAAHSARMGIKPALFHELPEIPENLEDVVFQGAEVLIPIGAAYLQLLDANMDMLRTNLETTKRSNRAKNARAFVGGALVALATGPVLRRIHK